MQLKSFSVAMLMVCVLLCGCGKGKETAAIALDEARLAVSSAKKAGAEVRAAEPLKSAEAAIVKAESGFQKGDYLTVQAEAKKAKTYANTAEETSKAAAVKAAAKTSPSKVSGKKQSGRSAAKKTGKSRKAK